MNQLSNTQEIIQAIRSAYGSLEHPNYSFMEKRYRLLLRHPFVIGLMQSYFVKNDTDLNDHAALHLHVYDRDETGENLQVCLSLISNFAMIFRVKKHSQVYSDILDWSTPTSSRFEHDILSSLNKHRFRLLSKSEASTSIDIELFNTDRGEANIYNAVISDDGVPLQLFSGGKLRGEGKSKGSKEK